MADNYPGEIEIGGKIKRTLIPDLCAAIRDEGVGLEWGERNFSPTTEQELLKALKDGVLWVCDDEARYGAFADLEDFLRENKIPFNRRSDGKYEYDPERVCFRPGIEDIVSVTNKDGDEMIRAVELRPILKALKKKAKDPLATLRSCAKKLENLLPPEPPPLPKFEIVD